MFGTGVLFRTDSIFASGGIKRSDPLDLEIHSLLCQCLHSILHLEARLLSSSFASGRSVKYASVYGAALVVLDQLVV